MFLPFRLPLTYPMEFITMKNHPRSPSGTSIPVSFWSWLGHRKSSLLPATTPAPILLHSPPRTPKLPDAIPALCQSLTASDASGYNGPLQDSDSHTSAYIQTNEEDPNLKGKDAFIGLSESTSDFRPKRNCSPGQVYAVPGVPVCCEVAAPSGNGDTRGGSGSILSGYKVGKRQASERKGIRIRVTDGARNGGSGNRDDGDDDGNDDDDDGRSSKRMSLKPGSGANENYRLLACPFYRMDPLKYTGCGRFEIRSTNYVRQHIARSHSRPPFYCPICSLVCPDARTRDAHVQALKCSPRRDAHEGITDDQREDIQRRRGGTERERWLGMWRILFPDAAEPDPSLIYMGNTVFEAVFVIKSAWKMRGADLLANLVPETLAVGRSVCGNTKCAATHKELVMESMMELLHRLGEPRPETADHVEPLPELPESISRTCTEVSATSSSTDLSISSISTAAQPPNPLLTYMSVSPLFSPEIPPTSITPFGNGGYEHLDPQSAVHPPDTMFGNESQWMWNRSVGIDSYGSLSSSANPQGACNQYFRMEFCDPAFIIRNPELDNEVGSTWSSLPSFETKM